MYGIYYVFKLEINVTAALMLTSLCKLLINDSNQIDKNTSGCGVNIFRPTVTSLIMAIRYEFQRMKVKEDLWYSNENKQT